MKNKRKSFVFSRLYADAISTLPKTKQLELFRAIVKYGLDQEEPELDGICAAYFVLIRHYIDTDFFGVSDDQE